jgi:hypothetical protein
MKHTLTFLAALAILTIFPACDQASGEIRIDGSNTERFCKTMEAAIDLASPEEKETMAQIMIMLGLEHMDISAPADGGERLNSLIGKELDGKTVPEIIAEYQPRLDEEAAKAKAFRKELEESRKK